MPGSVRGTWWKGRAFPEAQVWCRGPSGALEGHSRRPASSLGPLISSPAGHCAVQVRCRLPSLTHPLQQQACSPSVTVSPGGLGWEGAGGAWAGSRAPALFSGACPQGSAALSGRQSLKATKPYLVPKSCRVDGGEGQSRGEGEESASDPSQGCHPLLETSQLPSSLRTRTCLRPEAPLASLL